MRRYRFELADPADDAEWQSKLVLAVLLTLWVTVPYYLLQRWVFFPVHDMQPGPIDRVVSFREEMAWLYLSLYLLVPLAPLGLTTRCQVRRFALDLAVITLISHLTFVLWPTRVARPAGEASDHAYRLVLAVDNSLNACPSLHASLAVYSALWCHRLLRGRRRAGLLRLALWMWTLAILYATLGLRQHVLADLLAGTSLAATVYALPERQRRRSHWPRRGAAGYFRAGTAAERRATIPPVASHRMGDKRHAAVG
jgi:hypothetical protein